MRVAGEGDDEKVALLLGELKVADMAGVDDVEAAVAVNDGLSGGTGGGAVFEQAGQVQDLARSKMAIGSRGHVGFIGWGCTFS